MNLSTFFFSINFDVLKQSLAALPGDLCGDFGDFCNTYDFKPISLRILYTCLCISYDLLECFFLTTVSKFLQSYNSIIYSCGCSCSALTSSSFNLPTQPNTTIDRLYQLTRQLQHCKFDHFQLMLHPWTRF